MLCPIGTVCKFRKHEKQSWRSDTKSMIPPWVLFTFLNYANDIKLRKASEIVLHMMTGTDW